jgi:hypothetical protein
MPDDTPDGYISSHDREAPRPRIGTLWWWEPLGPMELVRVTEVVWNGEEWWVTTQSVAEPPPGASGTAWNDLNRFWEACHYVAPEAGPPRPNAKGAVRRGHLRSYEIRPGAQ